MSRKCTICIADIEEGQRTGRTNHCGHIFHIQCIFDYWDFHCKQNPRKHPTCPNCRNPFYGVALCKQRPQPVFITPVPVLIVPEAINTTAVQDEEDPFGPDFPDISEIEQVLHNPNEEAPNNAEGGNEPNEAEEGNTSNRNTEVQTVSTFLKANNPLVCEICGRKLNSSAAKSQHKRTHRHSRLQCTFLNCTKTFGREFSRKRHIRTKHSGSEL